MCRLVVDDLIASPLQLPPSMVRKGVHFLRDDVGLLADRTGKQFRLLEDRQSDFAEIVRFEYFTRSVFEPIPQVRIRRKNVAGAFDGAELSFLWQRYFPVSSLACIRSSARYVSLYST